MARTIRHGNLPDGQPRGWVSNARRGGNGHDPRVVRGSNATFQATWGNDGRGRRRSTKTALRRAGDAVREDWGDTHATRRDRSRARRLADKAALRAAMRDYEAA